MISRVAEHCYWLSRYLERAENTARFLEVNHTLLLDFHVPVEQQWRPLLIVSGIHDYKKEPTTEDVQETMTWDMDNGSSIVASLAAARENARIIREVISSDMWERLNFYHLWLQSPTAKELYYDNRHEFYGQIKRINQLLHGIGEATMSHGEAWDFFNLGKYLERGCQTARVLDVKYHTLLPKVEQVGSPVDHAHWVAILMSCSGYEPFHKLPRGPHDTGIAVAEFLLFDELFPRSVRRCLMECRDAAARISAPNPNIVDQEICALLDWMNGHDIKTVIGKGLHECLTHFVDTVHDIGNAIRETYFEVSFQVSATGQIQKQSQLQPPSQTQTQSQT